MVLTALHRGIVRGKLLLRDYLMQVDSANMLRVPSPYGMNVNVCRVLQLKNLGILLNIAIVSC